MEDILAEAREEFAGDRFAMGTGVRIEEVGDRYAKCSLQLTSRHLNAAGQTMGGAIFTLADFTFAVAANFRQPHAVTLESGIRYLTSPKGETLFAESRLIKDGKRVCFFTVDVTDELGTVVASVTFTGFRAGGGKWAGHRAGPEKSGNPAGCS